MQCSKLSSHNVTSHSAIYVICATADGPTSASYFPLARPAARYQVGALWLRRKISSSFPDPLPNRPPARANAQGRTDPCKRLRDQGNKPSQWLERRSHGNRMRVGHYNAKRQTIRASAGGIEEILASKSDQYSLSQEFAQSGQAGKFDEANNYRCDNERR